MYGAEILFWGPGDGSYIMKELMLTFDGDYITWSNRSTTVSNTVCVFYDCSKLIGLGEIFT